MNDAVTFVMLLFLTEVVEALIFYAPTLEGYFQKLYTLYKRHIFLFFIAMPGFYTLLYIILATGVLNGWMVLLVALKVADIFLKIEVIRSIFVQKQRVAFFEEMLGTPLPLWLIFAGAAFYATMLYFALV